MPDTTPMTPAELVLLAASLPLPKPGLLFVLDGHEAAALEAACDLALDSFARVPDSYGAEAAVLVRAAQAAVREQAGAYAATTDADVAAARVSCGLEPA